MYAFSGTRNRKPRLRHFKRALISRRIMAAPRLDRPFKLYTDASDVAVGAILVQDDNQGVERVIQYVSHAFNPVQRRWACIEREAYAIIYAIENYVRTYMALHLQYFAIINP